MKYEDFPEDETDIKLKIVNPRSLHFGRTGIPRVYTEKECTLQCFEEWQSIDLRCKWEDLEIVKGNQLLSWLKK